MKRVVPVLLLAGSVVACGPRAVGPEVTSTPDPTAGPVKSWPKSSSTVSTSPSPVKSADQLAAEEVVTEYFRLKNIVQMEPETDLEPFATLLAGSLLETQIPFIERDRENNVVQQGEFLYVVKGSKVADSGEIYVSACTDVAGTDFIDLDTGESILDPDLQTVRDWRIEARKINDTWKLTNYSTEVATTCDS